MLRQIALVAAALTFHAAAVVAVEHASRSTPPPAAAPMVVTVPPACQTVTPAPLVRAEATGDLITADLDANVRLIDPTHRAIRRTLLAAGVTPLVGRDRSVRIVPTIGDGRPVGFKVYAIRPGSLTARLGFENGDLVRRVNGADVTDMSAMVATYTALQHAPGFDVELVRQGVDITLHYTLD